jgi:hypothetical protein
MRNWFPVGLKDQPYANADGANRANEPNPGSRHGVFAATATV